MYRQEISSVYAFLVRQGVPSADLKDLTHDVFTAAINKWTNFDQTRSPRPWLLGFAWRVASDYRARKRPELVETLPDLGVEGEVAASMEARDARRLIQRGLMTLDEPKRCAFVMHQLEGLSVSEVSEAMGAPVQTTYSRLKAAREELAIAIRRIQRGES